MGSIYHLKPAFQRLLQPILDWLIRRQVTPNQVTQWAVMLSAVGGIVVWMSVDHHWMLLLIPIMLFIRMALNALDGMLARSLSQQTPLGEALNEVGDVISDALFYLPLIIWVPYSMEFIILVFAFVFLATLSEYCGILGKVLTGDRSYHGPMGKSDRAFAISLLSILYFFVTLPLLIMLLYFLVLDILLIKSCRNRLRAAIAHQGTPELADGE